MVKGILCGEKQGKSELETIGLLVTHCLVCACQRSGTFMYSNSFHLPKKAMKQVLLLFSFLS